MPPSGHKTLSAYPGITRPVLWALCVVAVIFIIYEIVENVWLQNLDNSTLHQLHLLRGIFTSLVAAVLVAWLIVKVSPSLFAPSLSADTLIRTERPSDQERLDKYNRWFIHMRWIAVLVAWVLTFFVVQVAEWLPMDVWWPLVITIASLALLNLAYEFFYRKGLFKQYLLHIQAYVDLIILVILLHFSGGIENPLSLLMLFHVIIAGIVLNRRHCFAVATWASILLALVAVGEATGLLNHYTLTLFPHAEHGTELAHASHQPLYVVSYVGLLTVIFFLTAYFVTTLADRIRLSERQLEKFADYTLEQRQLIEKALETTHTGLCVCNSKAEPYWTNKRWESWFGNHSIDSFAEKHQLKDQTCICNILKDGNTKTTEMTLPVSGNQDKSRTIRVTTAPLIDKEGRFDQTVSLAQDITEQKKVQKQLIRAGKLAAVGELSGHVAHEINNPIGIISAKCRLLLGDHPEELSPKVRMEIEKMTGAADRVAHIAKGLLSYCRPSPTRRIELDISAPIREALAMIKQRANETGIIIEDRLPEKLPPVNANADEIQQVFLNLFLNALDAMPNGGTLRIATSTAENNDIGRGRLLAIEVQDSGTGIPDDLKDQIFEPFFTTKEEGKGTGLGLSICAGLIRSHGGTIDVDSDPERGSRFKINLPLISRSEVAQ